MVLKLTLEDYAAKETIKDEERYLSESKNKPMPAEAYKSRVEGLIFSPVGINMLIEEHNTDDFGNQLIHMDLIGLYPSEENGVKLKKYTRSDDTAIILDRRSATAMRDFLNMYINNFPTVNNGGNI